MRALKFLIPLLIFSAIAVFLFVGLSKDPRLVPSPLVDKPAPDFSLPQLDGSGEWSPAQMRGKVWMLNVWGSWCAACVTEHPLLNELAANKALPIVGLAWKDKRSDSLAWLQRYGNPYSVVVSDLAGDSTIDYGVYGAPESFLIDKKGMIRFKQVGPFSPDSIRSQLLPLVKQLKQEAA
jgi:cytochrome c biogenesis protein CcmG/thiol:disulfide interchange protein DsbE